MRLFDLHCDTLYRAYDEQKTLNQPEFHLSADRGKRFSKWLQAMAIWVPDTITEEDSLLLFKNAYQLLQKECKRHGLAVCRNYHDMQTANHGVIFTVENAAALGGDIQNVDLFYEYGVRIVTLTWNAQNQLGGGADTTANNGLTPFGKDVVRAFNQKGIVCDVSHASDTLFNDVTAFSTQPVIATHSNARAVTSHKRNLTNEQFCTIKNSGGIVGLNFSQLFLNNTPNAATAYDIIKHAEHFLSLGGEDTLCIGSDFDGTDMPEGIKGVEDMEYLYQLFLKENYSETLLDKLFYKNAYTFFQRFDNLSKLV